MSYIENGSTPTELSFSISQYDSVLENISIRGSKKFEGLKCWDYNDGKKIMDILFTPFLKRVFSNHIFASVLVLEKYDDGDYVELIYKNDNFYVGFYDDWEQELSVYEKHSLNPKDIISKLDKKESFKEVMSLNTSNLNLHKEIDKLAYNIVREFKEEISKYTHKSRFNYYNGLIESLFYKEIIANYEEYPELAFVGTYYLLTDDINKLFNYVNKVIGDIIMSQGFIIFENRDYKYNDNINEITKDKIDTILAKNKITINNVKNKVLDTLKSDIVPNDISSIYFSNKATLINDEIQEEYSSKYLPRFNVFEFINRNLNCEYTDIEKYNFKIDEQEINLVGPNLMNFTLDITPKCYAPVKSYTVQIKYYFKQQGRVNFLKDFPNEKVSMQEISNWSIDIRYIKIYDMEESQYED